MVSMSWLWGGSAHASYLQSIAVAAAVALWPVLLFALSEHRALLRPVAAMNDDEQRGSLADRVLRGGGVAPRLRPRAWPVLLRLPSLADCAAAAAKLAAAADQLSSTDAEAVRIVGVDVPRTDVGVPAAGAGEERARLTRLLLCYASHDPDVGYRWAPHARHAATTSALVVVFFSFPPAHPAPVAPAPVAPAPDKSQGMSDVGARFLTVFEPHEEAVCVAAFVAFVFRQRGSFARSPAAGVGARLRRLGSLLGRADAAVGSQLARLRANDCVWALRPVVVLLSRELGPARAATLWARALATKLARSRSRGMAGAACCPASDAAPHALLPSPRMFSWPTPATTFCYMSSPRRCWTAGGRCCARGVSTTCC